MKKLISVILTTAMLMTLALGLVACGNKEGDGDKTIHLLNWGEYLDPDLKEEFKKRTGITIRETPVTSNEEMLIKLEADDCPYDMCIPSDYAVERLIAKNKLAQIDFNNIPNMKNIDPRYIELSKAFDPENKYSVPYTWGVLGILYNTTMVDEEDLGSWDILWNEKYSGKIYMYDSVRDSMAAALCKLGYDLNTLDPDEINAAADELIKAKALARAWVTDDVKDNMIQASGAIALVYSGDAVWTMEPDEGNSDLEFYVPEEGSNIYFDNMVIPVNSKKKALVEEFINFLLDPEIATQNTEFIGYSSPNLAVADLIDEVFLECSAYNISAEDISRCKIFRDLGENIKLYNDAWDRVHK